MFCGGNVLLLIDQRIERIKELWVVCGFVRSGATFLVVAR